MFLFCFSAAGRPHQSRAGHSGRGRRGVGRQDVLQFSGQEKPLPHHGVSTWRSGLYFLPLLDSLM